MYTGIVQAVGTLTSIVQQGAWTITIKAPAMMQDLALGASVACSGVCVTVIERDAEQFKAQLSAETLAITTASRWEVGARLNLERSLRMGDELGGHLLLGHVDGVARVVACQEEQESQRITFAVPPDFERFLAPKGSIALDGVSLTINEVAGPQFGVNIIPHTRSATNLGDRKPGDTVNFEVDMMARYIDRLLQQQRICAS